MSDAADRRRAAARSVLERDGREFLLRDWQVAWLIAVSEGRDGVVPQACGAGKGWLDARMRDAAADAAVDGGPNGG